MDRYEILILTIPEITKDEASTLEFQIEKIVNKAKGSIISFERWGKYKLSYPVKKNDYGVYFLVRFELEDTSTLIKDLNMLFAVKFSDLVARSVVIRLEKNQSLEYQKPPSLEDSPKRHISSFLEQRGLGSKEKEEKDVPDISEKVSELEDSVSKLKLSEQETEQEESQEPKEEAQAESEQETMMMSGKDEDKKGEGAEKSLDSKEDDKKEV